MLKKKPIYSTGIDISDSSIEIIELEKSGKNIKVKALEFVDIPFGTIKNGEIIDQSTFDKVFNDLLDKAEGSEFSFDNLTLSIPEEFIIHEIVDIDSTLEDGNIEAMVIEKIKDKLIENSQKWQYEIYELLVNDKPKYIYTGISTEKLYSYVKMINEFGLQVDFAEPDSASLIRNIPVLDKPIVVVDFGLNKTILYFSLGRVLYKKEIIKIGSAKLIKKLSDHSKLSIEKEEKFFRKIGFGSKSSEKQKEIIKEHFSKINSKIDKFLLEILEQFNTKVEEIYMTGGISRMVGISKVLNPDLRFLKITLPIEIDESDKLLFTNSVGASLRNLYHDSYKDDINFLTAEMKEKIAHEVSTDLITKEEDALKKVLTQDENTDEKKKELLEMFAKNWGDVDNKVKVEEDNNKWKISLSFGVFTQIMAILIVGLIGLIGLVFSVNKQNIIDMKKDNEDKFQNSSRDLFNYNLELLVSTGEDTSIVDTATILGRFEEYTVEDTKAVVVENGIVTQEIIDNAKSEIEKQIRSGQGSEVFITLKEGEFLIPEAVKYEEGFMAEDVNVGAQVETFNIEYKVKLKFAIVKESELDQVITNRTKRTIQAGENNSDFISKPVKFIRIEFIEEFGISKFNLTVEVSK